MTVSVTKIDVANSSETLIIYTKTHEVTARKTVFLLISALLHLTAFDPDMLLQQQRNKDRNEYNTASQIEVAWKYQIDDK